jgi:SAM-dependent methyltransferase
MKKQVDASHYSFADYVTQARFISFWHQVHEVVALRPRRVLEIGPGPGIVTRILRDQGIEVVTCDFVDDTDADVRASVTALPFGDGTFDVVLCCQVLEHIPFEESLRGLAEMRRVCTSGCVISLPQAGRYWAYTLHVPFVGPFQFGLRPRIRRAPHVFDGQHHWEIDKKGYPERWVRERYGSGFRATRSFRVHENHYHRFFVLLK